MPQGFPTQVTDFLRLKQIKEFVVALQARYGNSHNGKRSILKVVQGGPPEKQGSWLN